MSIVIVLTCYFGGTTPSLPLAALRSHLWRLVVDPLFCCSYWFSCGPPPIPVIDFFMAFFNSFRFSQALTSAGILFHSAGARAVKLFFLISNLALGTVKLYGSVVLRVAAPACLLFLTSSSCSPNTSLFFRNLNACNKSCSSLLCFSDSNPIS